MSKNDIETARFMGHIYESLVADIATKYGITMSVNGRRQLGLRLSGHGKISFLTKTLPAYGKSLERDILFGDTLEEPPHELLRLLTEKFQETYDPAVLLDIRQLAYLFYKYEIPYAPETEQLVLDTFVEVDQALPLEVDKEDPVLRKARAFITRVLGKFDHRDIVPKHGPGAVATGELPHEKSVFKRIYRQIEAVYPFCGYNCFNLSHVADRITEIQKLEELEDGAAKVVLVPKDSRGPRLISCEPLEYQWIQQGIATKLVQCLERHRLTSGHVNFTDQEVNRRLALVGSTWCSWATLDMKEASDRVSLALVKELFSGTPLLEGLMATRTRRTLLPNGKIVQLRKFAPMGSALCFPVESLVFYALSVAALQVYCGLEPRKARAAVYVYGDDIIVKSGYEPTLMRVLPRFGLMFNEGKCCYTSSHFRESCGMDAYRGVDVTPVKFRKVWSPPTANNLATWVSYHNEMRRRRYTGTADLIEGFIIAFYGFLPYTTQYSGESQSPDQEGNPLVLYRPGVNVVPVNRKNLKHRWNAELQRLEVHSYTIRPARYKTRQDGWEEILRKAFKNPYGERSLVGWYSFPRRVVLKRGWVRELL